MPIRDPNLVKDAFVSAAAGVNSAIDPPLIAPNELAWGVNADCRGGFPQTRPRFTRKTLVFADIEQQEWFETHLYAGSKTFYVPDGTSYAMASVGGRIFAIDVVGGFKVIELTPTKSTPTTAGFNAPAIGASVNITVSDASKIIPTYPIYVNNATYVVTVVAGNIVTAENINDASAAVVASGAIVIYLDPNAETPTVWMEQAEEFFIVQDGSDKPIICTGAINRRAANDEVPVGTAMVYNEEIGRLCVAVTGNQIKIGDVNGGPTSLLKFTETDYLAEGGAFRVPRKYGKVVGMIMLANLDRSNGQGAMLAFGERGISAFNLPPNRLTWKSLTYPPQVNMPITFGAKSQSSIITVNGDVFYRSADGLRSFVYAIREFSGVGNTPVSTELRRVLEKDDEAMLACASAILFDNRLLFTAGPRRTSNGTYHNYICSLDLNPASRMGQKAPPIYNGVWTGLRVVGMMTGDFDGEGRAFVFALNADTSKNEFWELHKQAGADDGLTRVPCSLELRSFTCGLPMSLKEAHALELWVDRVVGAVNFTVEYRPDSYPCWLPWETAELCVKADNCDEEGCTALQVFNAGYKTRIPFGQPPDSDESLDDKPARLAYEHQIRVSWTGQCRIRKVLFKAKPEQEEIMPHA